jgi:hypothetical protein
MIDSPEVLELDDSEFRLLVSIWCLAKVEDDGGHVGYTRATLRRRVMPFRTEEEFSGMVDHLITLDLLQEADGKFLVPRWEIHQYEYSSRIPSNRSDLRKDNGKETENEREELGKGLEAQGQIEPDTETDLKDNPPIVPPKIKHGEFVLLTDQEYQSLVTKHGQQMTDEMIEILNDKIGAKGYTYKSHYYCLRENNWVIREYKKIHAGDNQNRSPTNLMQFEPWELEAQKRRESLASRT